MLDVTDAPLSDPLVNQNSIANASWAYESGICWPWYTCQRILGLRALKRLAYLRLCNKFWG